jgi:hypothetical protein
VALNYVAVTCDLYDGGGNPVTQGIGYFSPTEVLTDATDHQIVTTVPLAVVFNADAPPVVSLVACDNSDLVPSSGWRWIFTPPAATGVPVTEIDPLHSNGSSQYLSALL